MAIKLEIVCTHMLCSCYNISINYLLLVGMHFEVFQARELVF